MTPTLPGRRALIGSCALGLLGVAVGVHLAGNGDPATQPGRAAKTVVAPTATPSEGDDPTVVALRYVLNGQQLLDAGPDGVDAILAPLVAPHARRELVDDNRQAVIAARARLDASTGPVRWRQAALAVRTETRGDAATVAVWHVGVLTAPGAVQPQSHWSTSTLELEDDDGEWRVTAETIESGPVPLNASDGAPSETEDFETNLEGFAAVNSP